MCKCMRKLHMFKDLQDHCGWNVVCVRERRKFDEILDSQGTNYAECGGLYLETWSLFWIK